MIYHTPEVKEQLEKFGIPVLVERSSYETDPLARMEWVKLYGILLGKQQEAEQLFDTQVQRVAPLETSSPPAKRWRFSPSLPTTLSRCAKAATMWPA